MSAAAHPLIAYLKYWLLKQDQYSLQSPQVFAIYTGLTKYLKNKKFDDLDLEKIRMGFLKENKKIHVSDLGAGSKKVPGKLRRISDITRYSTSSRKFNQLYQYFASLSPANTILELGTCMGINTRYLSRISQGNVYTLEGSSAILDAAFEGKPPAPIIPILGDISLTLPPLLEELGTIDFALIDANHTYEGTVAYFNQLIKATKPRSIIAIGDIHWSPEMEKAWNEIKSHPQVKLTLDFYECGLVFCSFHGEKTHFILDF